MDPLSPKLPGNFSPLDWTLGGVTPRMAPCMPPPPPAEALDVCTKRFYRPVASAVAPSEMRELMSRAGELRAGDTLTLIGQGQQGPMMTMRGALLQLTVKDEACSVAPETRRWLSQEAFLGLPPAPGPQLGAAPPVDRASLVAIVDRAAMKLQTAARGWAARRTRNRTVAATKLQATARGWAAQRARADGSSWQGLLFAGMVALMFL